MDETGYRGMKLSSYTTDAINIGKRVILLTQDVRKITIFVCKVRTRVKFAASTSRCLGHDSVVKRGREIFEVPERAFIFASR